MVRRTGVLSPVLLLAGAASAWAQLVPNLALATATYAPAATLIFKRDDQCPDNTFQCSEELGERFGDICCENGQICAVDGNDNPACCPSGAVCTGTAPATAATGVPTAIEVSYVSNQYFSFPYAPTSYPDSDSCKSAKSACSANYDACVDQLGESATAWGVTINVPGGGGTTVAAGAAGGLGSSATPVCSSLSSVACSDLEATSCAEFGDSQASMSRPSLLLAGVGAFVAVLSWVA